MRFFCLRRSSLAAALALLLLAGCASQQALVDDPQPAVASSEELLNHGYQLLLAQQGRDAMEAFDEVILRCDPLYTEASKSVYAARSMDEANYYGLMAEENQEEALIVASTCADALYLKAYAVTDLGRVEDAEDLLKRAVRLSPGNAMYLSELGHIYHVKRDWQTALALFEVAEKFAQLSPAEVQQAELLRAKRGVGYSLIEMGLLDRAEEKFRECLAIDEQDSKALNELEYIESLRKGGGEAEPAAGGIWEF